MSILGQRDQGAPPERWCLPRSPAPPIHDRAHRQQRFDPQQQQQPPTTTELRRTEEGIGPSIALIEPEVKGDLGALAHPGRAMIASRSR